MFLDQEWEVIPLVDTRLTHWFLLFTDDEEAWTLRTEVTGGKSYADDLCYVVFAFRLVSKIP